MRHRLGEDGGAERFFAGPAAGAADEPPARSNASDSSSTTAPAVSETPSATTAVSALASCSAEARNSPRQTINMSASPNPSIENKAAMMRSGRDRRATGPGESAREIHQNEAQEYGRRSTDKPVTTSTPHGNWGGGPSVM